MKVEKIGSRGMFFTYEDGDAPIEGNTSVYLINTEKRLFLCDTHMGPKSMEIIKQSIINNGWDEKELIVFNSHSDWDHVWGNCAFGNSIIIAHKKANERLLERGTYDLERLSRFHNGMIELRLPNLTFDNQIRFEAEEIEFIYAPGHTVDSSICYDKKDSVVFAGDLIEFPLPVINHHDLRRYLGTLELIRDFSPEIILSAHSGIVSKELLQGNIDYIKELVNSDSLCCKEQKDEEWQSSHGYNVKNRMFLKYLDIVKEKQKMLFDHKRFKEEFWSSVNKGYNNMNIEYSYFMKTGYGELEEALLSYISKL